MGFVQLTGAAVGGFGCVICLFANAFGSNIDSTIAVPNWAGFLCGVFLHFGNFPADQPGPEKHDPAADCYVRLAIGFAVVVFSGSVGVVMWGGQEPAETTAGMTALSVFLVLVAGLLGSIVARTGASLSPSAASKPTAPVSYIGGHLGIVGSFFAGFVTLLISAFGEMESTLDVIAPMCWTLLILVCLPCFVAGWRIV